MNVTYTNATKNTTKAEQQKLRNYHFKVFTQPLSSIDSIRADLLDLGLFR